MKRPSNWIRFCVIGMSLVVQIAAGEDRRPPTKEEISRFLEESRAEDARFAELVRKSDLICIGDVAMNEIKASHGDAGMSIEVAVEKVLKGKIGYVGTKTSAFYGGTYIAGDGDERIEAAAPFGRFVVFLKTSETDSSFWIADRYFGVLPYSSTVAVAIRQIVDKDSRAGEERGEQDGAGQPATGPESKPEDGKNPEPKSEPAPR